MCQIRPFETPFRSINDALHRPAYLHTGAKSPLRFYTPWLDIYPDGEDRWRDGWAGIGPSKGKIEGKDSLAAQKIDARDAKHVVSEHGFDERQWRISFRLSTSWSLLRFGSFKSIEEIHKKLRQGIQFHPKLDPEVIELINLHDRLWPPPVFTHGDLSSLNILVRGDGVVGIIDWETAGWLPSYWEYTTACQVNPQNYLWRDEIDRFLDPMPAELAMGKIYQKYFGDF